MGPRYTLPKVRRLSRRRDFARVLGARCRASDGYLVIYVDRNELAYSRLGLIVGRKHGPAVARNRLKRLVREAYRLGQHDLPAGYDYVCIPVAGRVGTVQQYQRWLEALARAVVARWQRRAEAGRK